MKISKERSQEMDEWPKADSSNLANVLKRTSWHNNLKYNHEQSVDQ